jgi:hypothetical protein
MLKTIRSVSFIVLLLLGWSCGSSDTKKKSSEPKDLPSASGGFSDIIVVANKNDWEAKLREDVYFILASPVKGLYNPEPEFDITQIDKKNFSDLFKVQRSILILEKNRNAKKTGVFTPKYRYAQNQLIITIVGKTAEEISNILFTSADQIRDQFDNHRMESLKQHVFENRNSKTINEIREQQKFSIEIPNNFNIIHNNDDIMFCSKQAKAMCDYGMRQECYYQTGVFVSTYPYTGKKRLSKDAIISKRNALTRKYVLGPERDDSTYVEVEGKFDPHFEAKEINGNYCVITKGWWNMVGATMGGPFVNLTYVDEQNQQLVMVDGFCFAPSFDKRQFIKELEAIARTIRFH